MLDLPSDRALTPRYYLHRATPSVGFVTPISPFSPAVPDVPVGRHERVAVRHPLRPFAVDERLGAGRFSHVRGG